VHALPSSQVAASLAVWTQPLVGSQESLVHGSWSSHGIAEPKHLLFAHLSSAVQASPSLHATAFGTNRHPVAGAQASSVQGLPSSHGVAIP
jgi:hypothetical protein